VKNYFRRIRGGSKVVVTGDASSWTDGLSSLFVELEVEMLEPGLTMNGWMFRHPFGDLTFVRSVTRGSHRTIRSERLIRQSTQNVFFVGFMLRGLAILKQDDHSAELRRGDIAVLDSTRTYTIEIPHAFDAMWVAVPRHRLDARLSSPRNSMARRINGGHGVGHLASNMLIAALEEAPRIGEVEANRISNHLLDLVALCLDQDAPESSEQTGTPHQQTLLRRIQQFIEENLDDEELSIPLIARAHAISVRYLRKLFEREGTSIARWIRIRRLERCRSDLESALFRGHSVNAIAFSHGFQNITSFNRAFRARFGIPPSAMRSRQLIDQRLRTDKD